MLLLKQAVKLFIRGKWICGIWPLTKPKCSTRSFYSRDHSWIETHAGQVQNNTWSCWHSPNGLPQMPSNQLYKAGKASAGRFPETKCSKDFQPSGTNAWRSAQRQRGSFSENKPLTDSIEKGELISNQQVKQSDSTFGMARLRIGINTLHIWLYGREKRRVVNNNNNFR